MQKFVLLWRRGWEPPASESAWHGEIKNGHLYKEWSDSWELPLNSGRFYNRVEW
jgi:hypothetical protein